MTPLRAEEITLFCEDKPDGRSQRILDAALSELRDALPFAAAVRTVGVLSKNDAVLRAKFARTQTGPKLRVLAVRDRDFLTQALVADARGRTFDDNSQRVMAWPLPRHSIESYLVDDDVLFPVVPLHTPEVLAKQVEGAATARRWLDVTRGTLEDLSFRLRRIRQPSVSGVPTDRATSLEVVLAEAAHMYNQIAEAFAPDALARYLDALIADMETDGPLRHRVDGRELVYDLELLLGRNRGSLLDALARRARRAPPTALVADLRNLLEAMPAAWRITEG